MFFGSWVWVRWRKSFYGAYLGFLFLDLFLVYFFLDWGFIFWTHVLFSVFCMGVGFLGRGVHVESWTLGAHLTGLPDIEMGQCRVSSLRSPLM